MDPWYSMGSGDMLEVAHMAVHVAQMASIADKQKIFDIVTTANAERWGWRTMGSKKVATPISSSCKRAIRWRRCVSRPIG